MAQCDEVTEELSVEIDLDETADHDEILRLRAENERLRTWAGNVHQALQRARESSARTKQATQTATADAATRPVELSNEMSSTAQIVDGCLSALNGATRAVLTLSARIESLERDLARSHREMDAVREQSRLAKADARRAVAALTTDQPDSASRDAAVTHARGQLEESLRNLGDGE